MLRHRHPAGRWRGHPGNGGSRYQSGFGRGGEGRGYSQPQTPMSLPQAAMGVAVRSMDGAGRPARQKPLSARPPPPWIRR